jgi:HEAT repeat protein
VGSRKPNIKQLVRRGDVAGLVEAASYGRRAVPGEGDDPAAPMRAEAILALGELGDYSGQEAVEAGIRDPDDRVRSAAVNVLHARHDGTALADALRSLPAEAGGSRELAILAIVDLGRSVSPPAVADALVGREDDELLADQDARLFTELVAKGDADARDAAIELLIEALADERGIVVDRAAELLVRLAPASTDALIAELHGGHAAADAAYVLGRIGDPETVDAMVEALRHEDPRVRSECTAALSEFEPQAAVKPLLRATRDPDHGVRVQAAIALDRMGTSAVIVGVAALLEPMIQDAVQAARAQRRPYAPNGVRPEAAARPAPARQ